VAFASGASAATIAAATTCSNDVDNTGGLGLICEITVVNRITSGGGSVALTGTATVTVRECHGAAGAPQAACSTRTAVLTEPVTAVTQCNNSINGGGGTLRCSAQISNEFIGLSPGSTAASVNQCVGSGGGITTGCNPFPANTTGASITQCNGSANGGTLVGLNCTATGTESAVRIVTINQCNGSANGGGALVICSANVTSNAAAASPSASPSASASPSSSPTPAPSATPTPTATVAPTATTAPTLPPTSTTDPITAQPSGATPLVLVGLSFLVMLSLIAASRRRRVRRGVR
jgi:hypothetical protein